jgi:multidrug efflux pump subunit AcrA (membrane-fusion protein)
MSLGSVVVGTGGFAPREVAVLPWSAAASKDGKPAVWVVDRKTNEVSMRPVQIEAYEREKLLVREGLAPGDFVVTEGEKFLFPGQIVAIAETAP